MKKNVWVVIPAYNEEKVIGSVIDNLKKENLKNIIVIDDSSHDSTAKVARKHGAKVYSHIINRGLGGALNTGITAALVSGADVIATCDADGQHRTEDVKRAVETLIKEGYDVVLGSRMINSKGMSLSRRLLNKGANMLTYLLFGIYVTDTQGGLRVFSRSAAEKIKIKTSRMEVSSEIIKEIGRNKLRFKEIPIEVIYTDYSLAKGQKNTNAFRIIYKLLLSRIMR